MYLSQRARAADCRQRLSVGAFVPQITSVTRGRVFFNRAIAVIAPPLSVDTSHVAGEPRGWEYVMAAVTMICPNLKCGRTIVTNDGHRGKVVRCPCCRQLFMVPAPETRPVRRPATDSEPAPSDKS